MAKLYLVGTPIGNLGDLSPRALQTLQEVQCIAAEDTRVTRKLLTHFNIRTPMISYHAHNQQEQGPHIVSRIQSGDNIALVSDAGMPCISDPGEQLVALCAAACLEVVILPGPSAAISALALSGLATGRFCFEGFLSTNNATRKQHLAALRAEPRTMVFYEAPHKLLATLRDLQTIFGDRPLALCRELTKLHEETLRTTLAQAVAYYESNSPRGEFVLVVQGAPPAQEPPASLEEGVELVLQLSAQGHSLSHCAREIASLTGLSKRALYKAALDRSPADNSPR
jgi:probable S-adenosylmethionine-dependent methyltransferase, YraL family